MQREIRICTLPKAFVCRHRRRSYGEHLDVFEKEPGVVELVRKFVPRELEGATIGITLATVGTAKQAQILPSVAERWAPVETVVDRAARLVRLDRELCDLCGIEGFVEEKRLQ